MNYGVRNQIMRFFVDQGCAVTPSEVGQQVGGKPRSEAASWAHWRLRQLVDDGWIEQWRKYGPYRLTKKGKEVMGIDA